MNRLWMVLLGLALVNWESLSAESVPVYGDENYSPIVFQSRSGPAGALVTILKLVSQKTGDRYSVELAPWNRAYSLSVDGKGGLVGASWNAERAKVFDFSVPLYNDDIQLVMLKGHEFPFRSLDDLKGKLIGGITGASYGPEVDGALASGLFRIDRDHAQAGRLLKLLAGRIDAAFIGNGSVGLETTLQQEPELVAKRAQFVVALRPVTLDPLHLAFPKSMNKRALLDRFDKAFLELKKAGKFDTTVTK